ncbi:MAG: hypothetical protein OM95_04730 [Bdellovibrio sp. ArHS]|uniref:DUF4097 family beta strand repeat-containing protein n=1 Tax=Bdellovibrio sp. ArHS TaxID=1569284 RepID=UPI0005824FC6|nr:DUF4097 family beta strand repeat-containing protein [Bdellovibrio sp. ArHS]KHD89138.1 MAG: hypothetical protein OM95_04730 [Bdellovibrio sp. ArHS]
MIKKILMGLAALFFILVGGLVLIMGYVFNNPESVLTAFHSVTDKFMQGQKYEEPGEFFLQGISQLNLQARRVDLVIRTHTGPTLKVLLHGKVPRFEPGPFIVQMTEQNALRVDFQEPLASNWIQMNVNGEEFTQESDAKLTADIYLPQSFKGKIFVKTEEGKVTLRLPEDLLYETDVQSVSGKITNTLKQKTTSEILPQEVGHIKIQTESGEIVVENDN